MLEKRAVTSQNQMLGKAHELWYVPIQFGVAAILHSISAVRIVIILWRIVKHSIQVSIFILTLFINWLVVCLFILPYEVYGIYGASNGGMPFRVLDQVLVCG